MWERQTNKQTKKQNKVSVLKQNKQSVSLLYDINSQLIIIIILHQLSFSIDIHFHLIFIIN